MPRWVVSDKRNRLAHVALTSQPIQHVYVYLIAHLSVRHGRFGSCSELCANAAVLWSPRGSSFWWMLGILDVLA